MSSELFHTIEQIGREKGLDTEIVIQALEEAYAAASRKYYHSKQDFGARFDRTTGKFSIFSKLTVVDEDASDRPSDRGRKRGERRAGRGSGRRPLEDPSR